MKKNEMLALIRLLLAPIVVILLGLVLVCSPDSASALIAKLLGWLLIAMAIGFGVSAIVTRRSTVGKGIAAVLLAVAGGWLVKNPLALAAWLGRLVGILLVIDGVQDILQARKQGTRFLMPLIVAVVGVVLILMPMTTSRLVFSLCGLVVLLIGIAMLVDRLKDRRKLNPPEDPDIIDAL